MIEAMKQALEALEQVTKELLAVRDELAERGARPTTNVFHQRLWDSSFSAYTDHAIPAAQSLRKAIAELESQKQGEPVACKECHLKDTVYDLLGDLKVANLKLSVRSQRTWVGLTDEELRIAFGKLYPSDIGILELAENNKDYAVEAIGARHHWTAFKAGARAGEAKLKEKNNG